MELTMPVAGHPTLGRGPSPGDRDLFALAQQLEASFLSEMLGAAGLGAPSESFGGGAGEEQFASFLRAEHAQALVSRGGIGLAETLFHALKAQAE